MIILMVEKAMIFFMAMQAMIVYLVGVAKMKFSAAQAMI